MKKENIHIRHIGTTEEFESLENAWSELLVQNHVQSAFLSWEWLFSWWKVYAQKKELWLISAWQNEELVGIIPLMLQDEEKSGFHFRTLFPLGSPHCDVTGVLVKNIREEILLALSKYLLEQKKLWDTLALNHFTPNDPALAYIKTIFQEEGLKTREKFSDHYYLELNETWEELHANLSRKFRKNLRRASRLAEGTGKVSMSHYSGSEVTWPTFQKIVDINQHARFPLIYQSPEEQAFHKELSERASKRDLVSIFLLSIDNIPLAYEYGFTYKKRYEAWRAGYDMRFDPAISIGKLLSKMMTEKAFELNYTEIDFLRGDEAYKRDWNTKTRVYTKTRFVKKSHLLARWLFIFLPEFRKSIKSLLPQKLIERR
ncbi:MAG: GNAT family N-acetyltransferase [Chloroflexi bacterium]|nr:GNAT family N-acetyltransferase [Chloroflexota bacterium]